MPLYHYRCNNCQLELSDIQPMDKADSVRCPSCGALLDRPVNMNAPGSPYGNIFRHVYLENAGPQGQTFASKSDLKKWCKQEGVGCSQLH